MKYRSYRYQICIGRKLWVSWMFLKVLTLCWLTPNKPTFKQLCLKLNNYSSIQSILYWFIPFSSLITDHYEYDVHCTRWIFIKLLVINYLQQKCNLIPTFFEKMTVCSLYLHNFPKSENTLFRPRYNTYSVQIWGKLKENYKSYCG